MECLHLLSRIFVAAPEKVNNNQSSHINYQEHDSFISVRGFDQLAFFHCIEDKYSRNKKASVVFDKLASGADGRRKLPKYRRKQSNTKY